LLEQTPGCPTLTFEKLYVMFTRVKKACKFRCLPLSPAFNKAKLYHLHPKILATKWRMDIGRDGYWKPNVNNTSALSVPKISKDVAARKKRKKIQSKRVLGRIKYTHRLVDYNNVTQ
jgi:hypothetical protein